MLIRRTICLRTTPRAPPIRLLAMLLVAISAAAQPGHAWASVTYLTPGWAFEAAKELSPGTYANSPPNYASSFFKVSVSRGVTLAAVVQPAPGGDFDLYLYNGYRQGMANSTRRELGASERAQLLAEVSGYYYVEVRYVSGRGEYTLTIDTSTLRALEALWGTAASPVDAAPGDLGVPLTVKVRNENSFAITDVAATLYLDDAFMNTSGGHTAGAHYSQQAQAGQSFDLSFTVSIGALTALGVHDLTMGLSYFSISGTTSTSTTTTTTSKQDSTTTSTSTSTSSSSPLLSASLPFNLTVPVHVPGRAVLQLALSNLFLQPGSLTMLILTARNLGSAPAGSAELTLTAPPPLALNGTGNSWTLGTILPGEEAAVPVGLYAPASAQGSSFQISSVVTYQSPIGAIRTDAQTLAVTVPSASDIQFTVLVEDQSLPAGTVSDVTFTVVNNGTVSAYAVDVTLTLAQPLSLAGKDSRWFAQSLSPQQAFSFQAGVYAPYGSQGLTYTGAVSISYRTPEGVAKTDVRGGIGFFVHSAAEAGPVLSVLVDKPELVAGQVNDVSLAIRNEGVSPASSLVVTLSTPLGLTIVGRSNRWFVPKVEPDDEAVLPLQVFASTGSVGSEVLATISLRYRDSRFNDISESSTVGFTVRGFIELYIMNIVTAQTPGRNLIVSGSVLNEGSITAKAVNVSLGVDPAGLFLARAGSSNFVGEAPVGLQTPFSINVLLTQDVSNGTYALPLEITFRDDRYELRRLTTTIPVTIVASASSQSGTGETLPQVGGLALLFLALPAVVFFIIGFLIATLLQRRRRRSAIA